jgi:eukaryotic-like serine/threonine-protein kinase
MSPPAADSDQTDPEPRPWERRERPQKPAPVSGLTVAGIVLVVGVIGLLIWSGLSGRSPTENVRGVVSTQVSQKDGMVMVFVPAGEFKMGSPDADPLASADEKPQHTVALDAYWIDQTEVTNSMYARCMAAGACRPPDKVSSYTHPSYYGNPTFDDYPVISVSWYAAQAYCAWREARLPTEAEWEKAARGTDARIYPWGKGLECNKANYDDCIGDTTQVGSYPAFASPYGLLDMVGNVWEWVADGYAATYYRVSPSINPTGPASAMYRSTRGGGWNSNGDLISATDRDWFNPSDSRSILGFRCARSQ